ncbi:MAG TPA: M56 family metallopeptidase [Candidatus Dormibacteraeota bacterium]|nr:M56 family metallopeptidase [Candidatus Dormibacteraeota bacterium]
MTTLAHGISPEALNALGWTLLHFVWQGAALAALFAVANTICRPSATRYGLAVITLGLMMAAPVVTFTALTPQKDPALRYGAEGAFASAVKPVEGVSVTARPSAPVEEIPVNQPTGIVWFVEAWFLGVVLLSLRTAGGLFLIERMRRKEIKPVARELFDKCLVLQKRMGLDRVIRYCECLRLDAPAVLGWIRPVVMLPARALTGLNKEQIEMIIAHELAHIRRLDCFVNLFQIGVETLLFYHPAVWWVSQRIRTEREHCSDDEAVALCGDAVSYARALTLMEEWRTAPSLMMAANRSPLSERVVRLLGLDGPTAKFRVAGMAVGVACLAGAVLAGKAFLGVAHAALVSKANANQAQGQSTLAVAQDPGSSTIVVRPANASTYKKVFASTEQAKDKDSDKVKEKKQERDADQAKKESYIEAMEAAGFKNLSADELIDLKIQGVTPAYVKEIHDLGMKPTAEEFIEMRVQGITSEYIREMRGIEPNLSVDDLIGMKVQGITPQYANEMRGLGLKADPENLIGIKVQGITPQYVNEMRGLGLKTDADDLIGMKVQGITPEYVRGIEALGFKPDTDGLIGMKVQGITPEYVKAIEATGLKPDVDSLIEMKVQGITPEYVKSIEEAGFKNVDVDELIEAKVQGITPEFIEKARKHGFQNLTLDKLIALKEAGVL